MEQLRHRLTNVSPKGQTCRADQNPLKRADLDDFVTCYNPNLPDPDVIAREIVKDLEAALQQFAAIANDLKSSQRERSSRLRVRSPYFDASHRPSRLFRLCRNADSAIRVTITGLASKPSLRSRIGCHGRFLRAFGNASSQCCKSCLIHRSGGHPDSDVIILAGARDGHIRCPAQ